MSPASAWADATALLDTAVNPTMLVWALCAATSITTSRHILVSVGFHYPCLLYFAHFSATVMLTLFFPALLQTETRPTLRPASLERRLLRTSLRTVLASLSGTLILQALLHAAQASTMSMLLVCYESTKDRRTRLIRSRLYITVPSMPHFAYYRLHKLLGGKTASRRLS